MDEKVFNEVIDQLLDDRLSKNIEMKYVLYGVLRVEDLDGQGLNAHNIRISKDLLPMFLKYEEPQSTSQRVRFDEILAQTYGKLCFLDLQLNIKLLKDDVRAEVEKIMPK